MLTAAAYHLHILRGGGFSPEDHLHVLGAAPAAHPPVHVPVAGGGDEEVTLPWLELHLHRGRGKGSENITIISNIYTQHTTLATANIIVRKV